MHSNIHNKLRVFECFLLADATARTAQCAHSDASFKFACFSRRFCWNVAPPSRRLCKCAKPQRFHAYLSAGVKVNNTRRANIGKHSVPDAVVANTALSPALKQVFGTARSLPQENAEILAENSRFATARNTEIVLAAFAAATNKRG